VIVAAVAAVVAAIVDPERPRRIETGRPGSRLLSLWNSVHVRSNRVRPVTDEHLPVACGRWRI